MIADQDQPLVEAAEVALPADQPVAGRRSLDRLVEEAARRSSRARASGSDPV